MQLLVLESKFFACISLIKSQTKLWSCKRLSMHFSKHQGVASLVRMASRYLTSSSAQFKPTKSILLG